MPTVEFSPVQLNYMIRGPFNGGIFGPSEDPNPYLSTMGNVMGKLVIFPGTIPAQPRLMTSANMSAALIFWQFYTENTTLIFNNPFTVTTTYKPAIATDTATWFALCYYTVSPPATNGSLQQRIIGTVGSIGSGEDLEMVTTSMVTGVQYRIYNFKLTLPSTYTY